MKIDKSNIDQYIYTNKFFYGTEIDCSNKGITSIEDIPDHITHIYCNNNQLTSLPKLPSGLTTLHCKYNKLNSLPMLPDNLVYLDCGWNNLTSVPIHNMDKQWMVNHNKLLNRIEIINKINETR